MPALREESIHKGQGHVEAHKPKQLNHFIKSYKQAMPAEAHKSKQLNHFIKRSNARLPTEHVFCFCISDHGYAINALSRTLAGKRKEF
jgi:hypothetical protein